MHFGKVINLLSPKQIKEEIIENEIIVDNEQAMEINDDKLIVEENIDNVDEKLTAEETIDNIDEKVIEEE